jgi:DNA-binding response OmpR family regulator
MPEQPSGFCFPLRSLNNDRTSDAHLDDSIDGYEKDTDKKFPIGNPMKKILLVEDTRHLSEEIEDVLKQEGFRVITAINALQALERLRESSLDLIITDIRMPWMDGFELIELIRKDPDFASVPVVILSATASAEDRIRGHDVGANAYLRKPCKVQTLISTINSLLE